MAPRTRSSGAPSTGHQQLAPETRKSKLKTHILRPRAETTCQNIRSQKKLTGDCAPAKDSLKRRREDDGSESDRESKRPHTAPHTASRTGTRLFERGTSFVGRNRARWQRDALTPRVQRLTDRPSAPLLRPASVEKPSEPIRRSMDEQKTPIKSEPRHSTVSWLMGMPARFFSPSKPSPPPAPPQSSAQEASPLAPRAQTLPPKPPSPQLTPIEKARQELKYKRRILQRKKAAGTDSARRIELLESKFDAEERELDAREEEFATEQVEGSKKRKLASNTFALVYSDGEDDDEASPPAAENVSPVTVAPSQPLKTPLKSALRSGQPCTTSKKLRINETPTRIKKLYGHYGPAGEYTGSTFAEKSRNSFSSVEEQSLRTKSTDDSSVPSDPQAVRHKVLSSSTKIHTHLNSMPASAAEKSREEVPNPFRTIKKGKPFVQPNSFRVPDLDEPSDEEDEELSEDYGKGETLGDNNAADTTSDATPASAPATPRMSHAELPETQAPVEAGGPAQDEHTRSKESEEAALKKLREAAQKYKPKTSSRLSTVEEKTRSQSSSPPAPDALSVPRAIINEEAAEQPQSGEGPHPAPYSWTQPPKRSYSTEAPDYEPWAFDDIHIGTDGMTDKQRRAARDAAADAWVAENVKWPEPPTYVDAGLCSNYIDSLVKTEVCVEGRERTDKTMGQQFEEILKWAHEEKVKGSQCALTWNNGREELVW